MSDDINAARDMGEDDADTALLRELRALAAEADPMPPDVMAAARSAIAWRTMDAELAELTADSSVESRELAGVRGVATPTMLTFEASGLTVEIELNEQADRRWRVLGQLVPPSPGTVEVRHPGGTQSVTADEVGRFAAGDLPAGPLSLRCVAGAHVVETDWFLV